MIPDDGADRDPIWNDADTTEIMYPWSLRHHRFGPTHFEYSGLAINSTNFGGVYSWHTGANTFCDGHVKFYPEDTDPELLLTAISRDSGERDLPPSGYSSTGQSAP